MALEVVSVAQPLWGFSSNNCIIIVCVYMYVCARYIYMYMTFMVLHYVHLCMYACEMLLVIHVRQLDEIK